MKLLKFDRKTFNERFGNKNDCYQHLAELKWEKGIHASAVITQDTSKASNLTAGVV